jgi:hypothetical protein
MCSQPLLAKRKSQWDSAEGQSCPCGMAVKRRGSGEDSLYIDQANGYWVGSVSLGFTPDSKRRGGTLCGCTKTEVRDKLWNSGRTSPRASRPASYSGYGRGPGAWWRAADGRGSAPGRPAAA